MKKTVSVNIKGTNFLIEEDAYELLQAYMNRLERSLQNDKGSKEIIEDIEYRIAELCGLELTSNKQVVELEAIQNIIETLGEPEQFVAESSDLNEDEIPNPGNESKQAHFSEAKGSKRLFRDVENGRIAGVCSGLAGYFNIDVIIVRIIFLVTFFFAGFGLPLYIILWIVTPRINSSIDRLRMQGKPITVDSVKEEIESAASRLENESRKFAHKVRNNDQIAQRVNSIGRFFSTAVGIGLVIFGTMFLIALLAFGVFNIEFIPADTASGFLSFSELGDLFFETSSDFFWFSWSAKIAGFCAVLFVYLLGAKLIFALKSKWTKVCLGFLFAVGTIGSVNAIFFGMKSGREFAINSNYQKKFGDFNAQSLVVEPQNNEGNFDSDVNINHDGVEGFVAIEGKKILESEIDFEFKNSTDSLYHIYQVFSSNGLNRKLALDNARNIRHKLSFENGVLHVPTQYSFPLSDKLRNQEVKVIIEIPKDKVVKMPHHTISLGTNDYDEDVEEWDYTEEGELDADGDYYHWN